MTVQGNGDGHRANPDPTEERDRELGRAEFRDPAKRADPSRSGEYDTGRRIPEYEAGAAYGDNRDPDEIERDIERTRADMDETLDALERKLSPGQIMDQAIDYLRSGPGGFASNFGTTIRDNPLPVALTAIGVGWMMFAASRGDERTRTRYVTRYHYDDEYAGTGRETDPYAEDRYGRGYGATGSSTGVYSQQGASETSGHSGGRMERVKSQAEEARHRASDMAHRAQETTSDYARRAWERASDYTESARSYASGARGRTSGVFQSTRHRAGELGRTAKSSATRTREGFSYMLEEHPLTLGAVGIAVGALLGAAMPSTRRESEMFGETRDEFVHRAREFGREEANRARRVAEAATEAAHEEADRQGMTSEGKSAASSGTKAESGTKAGEKKAGAGSSDTSGPKNAGGGGI